MIRPKHGLVYWVLAATGLLLIGLSFALIHQREFFWDLGAYQRAIADFSQGVNPYRMDVKYVFVYHPLVLRVFCSAASVMPLAYWLAFFYIMSCAWLALELRHWLGQHGFPAYHVVWALIGSMAFGGLGAISFASGNVTTYLHFALLAGLLRAWGSPRPGLRYLPLVLTLVASLIKPYFLAYLFLMPVLWQGTDGKRSCRAALELSSAAAAWSCLWWGYSFIRPKDFDGFLTALKFQALDSGDCGFSFFGLLLERRCSHGQALLGHAFLSLALIALCFWLLRNVKKVGRSLLNCYGFTCCSRWSIPG